MRSLGCRQVTFCGEFSRLVGCNAYHEIQICKFYVNNCFQRRLTLSTEPSKRVLATHFLPIKWGNTFSGSPDEKSHFAIRKKQQHHFCRHSCQLERKSSIDTGTCATSFMSFLYSNLFRRRLFFQTNFL